MPMSESFAAFSATLSSAPSRSLIAVTASSLTLVRLIVTVASSNSPPPSVTRTVSVNVGVISKSTTGGFRTMISPVPALMPNAPLVFPATML